MQEASIFEDTDEDGKFDVIVDKPWICRPNFAGVSKVLINPEGGFQILRDDTCYIDTKPNTWYNDNNLNVYHPVNGYSWFLKKN